MQQSVNFHSSKVDLPLPNRNGHPLKVAGAFLREGDQRVSAWLEATWVVRVSICGVYCTSWCCSLSAGIYKSVQCVVRVGLNDGHVHMPLHPRLDTCTHAPIPAPHCAANIRPTANLENTTAVVAQLETMETGIYCGWCAIGEPTEGSSIYKAAVSVGYNPTFKGEAATKQKMIEPHVSIHLLAVCPPRPPPPARPCVRPSSLDIGFD